MPVDPTMTVYLIQYDPTEESMWLHKDDSVPLFAWRDAESHYPWLMGSKLRKKWARAWKRNHTPGDRNAGTYLELCAFPTEDAARRYARTNHPGALDGYDGTMSFPTMTVAEVMERFGLPRARDSKGENDTKR